MEPERTKRKRDPVCPIGQQSPAMKTITQGTLKIADTQRKFCSNQKS